MATITVRRLDSNYDPVRGNGASDFISDLQAVSQIIMTTLKLFQGEWFENLNDGTPLFQKILGKNGENVNAISLILQQRIRGVPYVTGVSNVNASFNSATRGFSFSCVVQTQFGSVSVSFSPGSSAVWNT
jgi:hypothetical protein